MVLQALIVKAGYPSLIFIHQLTKSFETWQLQLIDKIKLNA